MLLVALAASGCSPGGDSPPPAPEPVSSLPAPSPSPTPTALPPAADGSNLEACKDGQCQVLVSAPAELLIRDVRTTVTVRGDKVSIRQTDDQGSSSQITVSGSNGSSSISTAQGQLTVRISGVSGNDVLLDISSS